MGCQKQAWSQLLGIVSWLGGLACVIPVTADETPPPVDYAAQVRPLLKARCVACHGALKQSAGLRLDTAAALLRGGDSGAAVVAGDSTRSLLLERISAAESAERMPPEGEPLSAEQVRLIRDWIDAGAHRPDNEQPDADPREHWAYRPILRPGIPAEVLPGWSDNPIDAFISRGYLKQGLKPQPTADRRILLRRLSLDLIGVPPTPEEIADALGAPEESWYERTVERLLADPRHGERWARHWMDVWRYSDWWGLGDQLRNSQKHIWHWRDWMIESLNVDLPYDEMIRLMLAADEITPTDLDRLRATGFLARNYFLFNRNQWMDEVVEHVGKGFLGLTMNCSKCHDHKYDPISQVDYYRMRAFFEPYHVRVDLLPGESDLNRNGLPRVFDGLPDLPTWVFIRGNENAPDKSQAVSPGLPGFLEWSPLQISPVDLPREAFEPGVRPWIAEGLGKQLNDKITAARLRQQAAQTNLSMAEEQSKLAGAMPDRATDEGDGEQPKRLLDEKFTGPLEDRWRILGGTWHQVESGWQQKTDGEQRGILRWIGKAPRDFEASLKVTIHGGSRWRSVGITFDTTNPDPRQPEGAGDSEQNVYVSAFAEGPKVQAAWQKGGVWNFPPEGASARPVELNRSHVLKLQVRGSLINAFLDDVLVVAFRTPLERREGHFQVITFDCLATLHEVVVDELPATTRLREPGETGLSPVEALEVARLEARIADLAVIAAEAELVSLQRRAEAQQLSPGVPEFSARASAASLAERQYRVAQAEAATVERELQLKKAAPDKREAAEKGLAAARMDFDKAVSARNEPGEQFTPLVGAVWTATRFFNSTQDDPAVPFVPRSTGRRKALAEWIANARNPLTARVVVNQVWARHMGAPLAPAVFDLGLKSPPPVHRELLDWLAADFIDNGWSFKNLHRQIVLSQTYRLQSSLRDCDDNLARDPDNTWWWRRPTVRMESQAVRDAILSLAGRLETRVGGPPVPSAEQGTSNRRSLYFFHSNNERNLFLTTFDEALVKECYRREQSVVPQQALALSNSSLVLESALPIARRIREAVGGDRSDVTPDGRFIRSVFQVVLGTEPNAVEIARCQESLDLWRQIPGWGGASEEVDTQLVWVLLNHSDFVTVQ